MSLEISNRLKEEAIKKAKEQRVQSEQYQDQKAEREEKERVRYVQVQKIVEKPVYRQNCLESDGVDLINQALIDGK